MTTHGQCFVAHHDERLTGSALRHTMTTHGQCFVAHHAERLTDSALRRAGHDEVVEVLQKHAGGMAQGMGHVEESTGWQEALAEILGSFHLSVSDPIAT